MVCCCEGSKGHAVLCDSLKHPSVLNKTVAAWLGELYEGAGPVVAIAPRFVVFWRQGLAGGPWCFGTDEQGNVSVRPALQPPGDSTQKQLNIFFLVYDFTTPAVRYHLALCVWAGWHFPLSQAAGSTALSRLAGRSGTALCCCPGSLTRSPPDKEQGAGKHQAGFQFQCPSWQCGYDVLDLSLKGIIFEYQV